MADDLLQGYLGRVDEFADGEVFGSDLIDTARFHIVDVEGNDALQQELRVDIHREDTVILATHDHRTATALDARIEDMVNEVRTQAGLPAGEDAREEDEALEERLSEIRLTKDAFELEEMRRAVAATKAGFEDIIRVLPRAVGHRRGERVIEGAFRAVAREEGNGEGYETIAASGNHANTLHWIDNDGTVREGDLVLVDAGIEVDSLYTADITRTLPVNGRFTPVQARVYQAVLDACEAALARANQPGCRFKDVHDAAMGVIAARLHEWGILPVTPEESLAPGGQQHQSQQQP